MKILDLFCCQGGASMGLHYAFPTADITGVDIFNQPRYPFTFIQADALTFPLDGYDLIWASPPCQRFSKLTKCRVGQNELHEDLIVAIRERLAQTTAGTVIENVMGSPLINPIKLCGSMFNLHSTGTRYLQRHRLFETNFPLRQPKCNHIVGSAVGVYGHGSGGELGKRMRTAAVDEAKVLMQMPWASRDGLSQAVPPAYAEYIGKEYAKIQTWSVCFGWPWTI